MFLTRNFIITIPKGDVKIPRKLLKIFSTFKLKVAWKRDVAENKYFVLQENACIFPHDGLDFTAS